MFKKKIDNVSKIRKIMNCSMLHQLRNTIKINCLVISKSKKHELRHIKHQCANKTIKQYSLQ